MDRSRGGFGPFFLLREVIPSAARNPYRLEDDRAPPSLPLRQRSFILEFSSSLGNQVRSSGSRMPKRTFQPNRRHRSKTHGFRKRMKTKAGQAVLSRRRAKGRKRVSVKPGFREQ